METWNDVLVTLIGLIALALGAPIIQLLKRLWNFIFKTDLKDEWAVVFTGIMAAGIAVLNLWLMGELDFQTLTIETFPQMFFAVFASAAIFYKLFKDSSGVLGNKFLLKG